MYKVSFLITLFLYHLVALAQAPIELIKSEALKSSVNYAYVKDNDSVFVYYVDERTKLKNFDFVILDKKTLKTISKVVLNKSVKTKGAFSHVIKGIQVGKDRIYVFSQSSKYELFVSTFSLQGILLKEPKYLTGVANNIQIEPRGDGNSFYIKTNNSVYVNYDFVESEYLYDAELNLVNSTSVNKKFCYYKECARFTDNGKIYILSRSAVAFTVYEYHFSPIWDKFSYCVTVIDKDLERPSVTIPIPINKEKFDEIISFQVKNNVLTFKGLFNQDVEGTKKDDIGIFSIVFDLTSNKVVSFKEKIIKEEIFLNAVAKNQKVRKMYFNLIDVLDMHDGSEILIFAQSNVRGIYGSYMSGQESNNLICLRLTNNIEYTEFNHLAKDQVFKERFLEIEPANKYKDYDMLSGGFPFVIEGKIHYLYNDTKRNINTNDAAAIKEVKLRRPKHYGLVLAVFGKSGVEKHYIHNNKDAGMVLRFDTYKENFSNYEANKLLNAVSIKGNKCYLVLLKAKK